MNLLKRALRTLFKVIAVLIAAVLLFALSNGPGRPPIYVFVCFSFGLLLVIRVLCLRFDRASVQRCARAVIDRHKAFAMPVAATYAERLYEHGDRRGAPAWNRVVVEIARLQGAAEGMAASLPPAPRCPL